MLNNEIKKIQKITQVNPPNMRLESRDKNILIKNKLKQIMKLDSQSIQWSG
jgi:hypothetical protein